MINPDTISRYENNTQKFSSIHQGHRQHGTSQENFYNEEMENDVHNLTKPGTAGGKTLNGFYQA
jgi:hypothetical protein